MFNLQKAFDKTLIGLFRGKNSAFLSSIYCSLKFRWNTSIPTANVNGVEMQWNPDWFESLSEDMRVTVLAHELWHVAFMHMARMGARDHRAWVWACDHAINLMLIDHGYKFDTWPAGHPHAGQMIGLADPQYRDMPSEQIYEHAINNRIQINLDFGEDFSTPNKDNPLDPVTPEMMNELLATVLRAHTMQQLSGIPGHMPDGFLELIDHLSNPTVPWETQLQRWLTERSDKGYDMTKPNRRYADIYLPSNGGENGLAHLLWAIDSSGSMTPEQLQRINSEIAGAKDMLAPERMTIVAFDTVIQDTWEFTDAMDMHPLEIHGRGGTDMTKLFEFAKDLQPQAMLIFSDMGCDYPDEIPGVFTCWICLDRPNWEPPYGTVIHMEC